MFYCMFLFTFDRSFSASTDVVVSSSNTRRRLVGFRSLVVGYCSTAAVRVDAEGQDDVAS